MKLINVEWLLGHDIGVSGHYYRPFESDVLEDYMTHAADALTIDPTQRLQTRVKELETGQTQEIDRLKAQLEAFDSQHSTDLRELNIKFQEYMARILEVEAGMNKFKAFRNEHLKSAASIRSDIAKEKLKQQRGEPDPRSQNVEDHVMWESQKG
jgi:hypothetical protein